MKRNSKNNGKTKTVIKCDCGDVSVCPPARMEDGGPTNENVIAAFFHCKQCIKELPIGESPRTYSSLEVGWTEIGFQVWCKRHEINVMHVDFQGHKHPANLKA